MNSSNTLLKEARTHHQAGRLADAQKLYRQLLVREPDCAEAHIDLALALLCEGKLDEALVHCRQGIALEPGNAEGHCQLGNVLALQNKLSEAGAPYRQAILLKPDFAQAHNNLGNVLFHLGRLDEAIASYDRALAVKPDIVEAHNNLGMIWLEKGDLEKARAAFAEAVTVAPGYAEAHNSLGHTLLRLNRPEEAAEAFRRAVAAKPDYAEAYNNLATALGQLNRFAEAVQACRNAIRIRPNYPEAHKNLGKCLLHAGAPAESEACLRNLLVIAPHYADGYRHMAMALGEMGRADEALAYYSRHAEMVFGPDSRARPPAQDPPHKQRHDREQQAWLGGRAAPFLIGDGARIAGPAVNRHGREEINAAWRTARPQIAVIDDLLTAPALEKLRRFCLDSTIWRDSFENGYLGALPEHGFAPPLLVQIAEELRAVCPAIIEDYPLLQFWAFKYDSDLKGIQVHADFAAVNVNFWLTPDDANLERDHGGLMVWDTAAPADWNFAKYNTAETDIRAFLAKSHAKPLTVPYRANRAVIFDSDLFHETDTIRFKPGYENRRINITLLFGRRQHARAAG